MTKIKIFGCHSDATTKFVGPVVLQMQIVITLEIDDLNRFRTKLTNQRDNAAVPLGKEFVSTNPEIKNIADKKKMGRTVVQLRAQKSAASTSDPK